jgi:hypothetical protein
MIPASNATILLSELNVIIAEQKGVNVDELAVTDGKTPNKKTPKAAQEIVATEEESIEGLSPAQLRSKADALFKQAQTLRKQADEIDPPKSKKKKEVVEAE